MAVIDLREKDQLTTELAGLDALERDTTERAGLARRAWSATWPKLAAIAIAIGLWQLVVDLEWRPEFVLPSPFTALDRLGEQLVTGEFWRAVSVTMSRAAIGFTLAVLIGSLIGAVVARNRLVRTAVGSLITGLQTMPSIAWFPLAILLFKLTEQAILFVVVLGAAPSVANGLIAGVDNVPPLLLRSGRVIGARGLSAWRHVVLPAALPSVLAGLKQGWAFAWRSLMAGELLVIIANRPSVGVKLTFFRELSDSAGLMATMIVILVIGVVVDSLVFGSIQRVVRKRYGLVDASSS